MGNKTPCCLTHCGGFNVPCKGPEGPRALWGLTLRPLVLGLGLSSAIQGWEQVRALQGSGVQLLSVTWARWTRRVPAASEAGLGLEGKLIPGPLRCCKAPLPGATICSLDGPVLPVPETQLAEEQNKTTQSQSNSSPFLQRPVVHGGCASALGCGAKQTRIFARRHLRASQHNSNCREIPPCNGNPLACDTGFICIFSKRKKWV